jgi:protein-S-isoprenylcysteine O-methyltransferase Ste14
MIISFDFIFRVGAILIYLYRWFYWWITEAEANKEKPKNEAVDTLLNRSTVIRFTTNLGQAFLIFQLLGLTVLPIENANIIPQSIGFLLIVLGTSLGISARKTIGTNWSHAAEYQVKKKQELVTSGVYAFIRHPIYAGLVLSFIGGELVAKSYVAFFGILFFIGGYYQARLEEKLLTAHFGESYKTYMKRSKMFLPYLW